VVTGVLSSGLKQPRREDDHSLASNAEVKNKLSSTSTPLIGLYGVDNDRFTSLASIAQNLIRMALLD
jgi:hypothetical protein